MPDNAQPPAPLTLAQRVDALTEILISLTRFRDEAVENMDGLRDLAKAHAVKAVDTEARRLQKETAGDLEKRVALVATDFQERAKDIDRRIHSALTARAGAIEKKVLAERQKAVELTDVLPALNNLVSGAIEQRREELERGADEAASKAIRAALEKVDLGFAGMSMTGDWDPSRAYNKGDVVYYKGGSFAALAATKEIPDAVSKVWQQIAAPGRSGRDGEPGRDGIGGDGSGDVVGPASATNGGVVLFDGATGKLLSDSGLTIAGSGATAGATQLPRGNAPEMTNAREWTADTVGQAEAEAGTATTRRAWTAQRIRQAIAAWWQTITLAISDIAGLESALDGKASTTHAATHATGGADEITPAAIGAATAAHTHGEISDDGKIGTTAGLPIKTGTGGVLEVGAFGKAAGQFAEGNSIPVAVALGFNGTLEDAAVDSLPLPLDTVYKAGSTAYMTAEENPTTTVEITLAIAATTIGKLSITSAGAVTWTEDAGITADTNFDAGDIITATGPATADTDLAGLRITLALFAR